MVLLEGHPNVAKILAQIGYHIRGKRGRGGNIRYVINATLCSHVKLSALFRILVITLVHRAKIHILVIIKTPPSSSRQGFIAVVLCVSICCY